MLASRLVSMDYEMTLWNLEDGTSIGVLRGVIDGMEPVAFSPDGKTIAGLTRGWYGEAAMLWDAETGRHIRNLGNTGETPFWSLRFAPDGQSISLQSHDGTLQVVALD
jgi:WD40 repeat protein